jgi:YHS domain-containing protein
MKVDRAKAIRKEIDGQTHYFCSEHCLHSFTNQRPSGHETDPPALALQ